MASFVASFRFEVTTISLLALNAMLWMMWSSQGLSSGMLESLSTQRRATNTTFLGLSVCFNKTLLRSRLTLLCLQHICETLRFGVPRLVSLERVVTLYLAVTVEKRKTYGPSSGFVFVRVNSNISEVRKLVTCCARTVKRVANFE